MSDGAIRESAVRVFVADDFELWRRHVVAQLKSRTDLLVVGEASDGPDALRKVEELAPALILLDVGLPGMDGIAVASAIIRTLPKSNILIISAHNSGAIVRAAFRAGARGYLSKSDVGRELIPAIDAVLRGDLFVSGGVASDNAAGEHAVQFYADDRSLVASCCDLVVGALRTRHPVIVVATKIHRDWLNDQFAARGVEISSYVSRGYYIVRDAAETLSDLMNSDLPDPAAFFAQMGGLLRQAEAVSNTVGREVVVFGEMVGLLVAQRNHEAAIELERLWNALARRHTFCLRCAYRSNVFPSESQGSFPAAICAEHSVVVGT